MSFDLGAVLPPIGVPALITSVYAAAVNGITLLWMYLRLFCCTRAPAPAEQYLRPRERIGFTAIVISSSKETPHRSGRLINGVRGSLQSRFDRTGPDL